MAWRSWWWSVLPLLCLCVFALTGGPLSAAIIRPDGDLSGTDWAKVPSNSPNWYGLINEAVTQPTAGDTSNRIESQSECSPAYFSYDNFTLPSGQTVRKMRVWCYHYSNEFDFLYSVNGTTWYGGHWIQPSGVGVYSWRYVDIDFTAQGEIGHALSQSEINNFRGQLYADLQGEYVRLATHYIEPIDLEISQCPSDWLPTYNDTVSITATIKPSGETGTITFTLPNANVSDEPGYCMNAGTQTTTEEDLQFVSPQSGFTIGTDANGDPTATTTSSVNSATVQVKCYDYGAYGQIQATAALDCGGTLTGHVVDGTDTFVRIPRDDDDNHLADGWEADMEDDWEDQYGDTHTFDGTGLQDDEKADPDSQSGGADGPPVNLGPHDDTGDGLTVYEEYRGFQFGGSTDNWKRLSPCRKELLVEADFMAAGTTTGGSGTSTGLGAFVLYDSTKTWTENQFVGMKLNPNTTQSELFYITANTATTITISGGTDTINMMIVATAGDSYAVSTFTPMTETERNNTMANTASAFINTAGVEVNYVVDDTGVAWADLNSDSARSTFMSGCRETGNPSYSGFVHLAFVDYFRDSPTDVGLNNDSWDGGLVGVWRCRYLTGELEGVTDVEALSSTAVHELGHTVQCHDHYNSLNQAWIMYISATADNCNNIRFKQVGITEEIPDMDVKHNYAN